MTEKRGDSSNVLVMLIGLAAVVVIVVLFFFSMGKFSFSKDARTITLAEFRSELMEYLNSEFYKNQDYLAALELKHLPELSWAMLGLARQIELSDREDKNAEQLEATLKNILTAWTRKGNAKDELYSMHQLYSAGTLLESEGLLNWVRDRHSLLRWHARANLLPAKSHGKINSYLLAAASRQLSQGLRLSPSVEKAPNESWQVAEPEKFAETLAMAKELIVLAEQDQESGMDSSYPPLFQNGSLHQTACWIAWAEVSLLRSAILLPEQTTRFSTEAESHLIDFFEILDTQLLTETPNFLALQTALPCLHTIIDLKEFSSEGGNVPGRKVLVADSRLNRVFKNIIEKTVLPAWDSRSHPLCAGDGGVFSNLSSPEEFLCKQEKNVNDNSWLAFVLSPELNGLAFHLRQ